MYLGLVVLLLFVGCASSPSSQYSRFLSPQVDSEQLQIGDIIYSDGTTSSKDADLEKGKLPVAIVVGFKETSGGVIGLGLYQSESRLQWAPRKTKGFRTRFSGIISTVYKDDVSGDTDGSDNWEYIKRVDKKGTSGTAAETNYPAFYYAANYGITQNYEGELADGWYMPSLSEMCFLYKNKEIINRSLEKCGGTLLKDNYYWSSSQAYDDKVTYAWIPCFNEKYGFFTISNKYDQTYVCVMRHF